MIKGPIEQNSALLNNVLGSVYGDDPRVRDIISSYRTDIVRPWSSVRRGNLETMEGIEQIKSAYKGMFNEIEDYIQTEYNLPEIDPNEFKGYNYMWEYDPNYTERVDE